MTLHRQRSWSCHRCGARPCDCRIPARWVIALTVGLIGCRVPPSPTPDDLSRDWSRQESVAIRAAEQLSQRRVARGAAAPASVAVCDSFLGTTDASELAAMDAVIEEVLLVNADLEASEAAWQAAMELYPQAASWDDPNFRFQNGPTIFGASQGAHLWRLQVSQVIPWFGKTGLRGEMADRNADVAHYQWRQTRQKLVRLARKAYIEYAFSERLQELQQEDYQLAKAAIDPFPTVAQAGLDLEALEEREAVELDLLELEEQQHEIGAAHRRSRDQLNVLLHRELDAPLPSAELPANPPDLPDARSLVEKAFRRSPELAIARQREQQAEAARKLAEKDFYPDVRLVGRFDTNASRAWAPDRVSVKPQLGIYIDPPLQQRRRWARLRETNLKRQQRQAETRAIESAMRSEIERTVAEMERSNDRIASLDRLIAAAQRRAETQETLVAAREGGSTKHLAAKRTVLKYQMKRLKEEADLILRFNELAALTGEDSWIGDDPAHQAGRWRSSIQFLPSPANDWMDSLRSIRAAP